MWVYIKWQWLDYSAMRGPCPQGFHIPSKDEWVELDAIGRNAQIWGSDSQRWTDYKILKTALKLPFAWWRDGSWNVSGGWSMCLYWSSTPQGTYNAYYFYCSNTTPVDPQDYYNRGYWMTLRPFYDTPIDPYISEGELLSGWQYLDWNTFVWGLAARNPTLWLISVRCDWWRCITIADKNLWATTTYEYDIYGWGTEPTRSQANCGNFFQRWNNYKFPYSWTVSTSSTKVDASAYWPWNYYSSSTFITWTWDWSSVQNDNLRWGVTWTRPLMLEIKNAYVGDNT